MHVIRHECSDATVRLQRLSKRIQIRKQSSSPKTRFAVMATLYDVQRDIQSERFVGEA